MVQINSGGAALSGSPGSLVSPLSSDGADGGGEGRSGRTTTPGSSSRTRRPRRAPRTLAAVGALRPGRVSAASNAPTHNPEAPENQDKTHWIEIELVDEEGKPITGEPYKITLPDGKVADGTTDSKGRGEDPEHRSGAMPGDVPESG